MKFAPLAPADLQFDADGLPVTARFADVYHARAGALEQADAVFLGGNGLPQRWRGRERFVILETGLGLAHNFLATWREWRNDPQRCRRLHYIGIDRYPVLRADLVRAHRSLASEVEPDLLEALHTQWPIATPDLHRLVLDGGRVILDCVWADVIPALRELRVRADAVYLDGFSPRRNPAMWSPEMFLALEHRLQADATAATWSASRGVREGLERLRFTVERQPGFGGKRHRLQAQRGPEHPKAAAAALRAARIPHPGHTPGIPWVPGDPPVLILGGGMAGAACAFAFHRRGIPCRVVDAAPDPAAGASGNPAGLVHAVVHRDDGSHARLLRTAALYAARTYRPGLKAGWMNGALEGLVRRVSQDPTQNLDALRALQQTAGLPEDLMQWVDAGAATGLAALNGEAACLFPDGGWIDPGAWVRTVMALDGIQWSGGQSVAAVEREAGEWVLRGADQVPIARAPWLVMAAAGGLRRILPSQLHQSWPWGEVRGQITQVPGHEAVGSLPRLPVSGGGYGLTLAQPGGESTLVCGATSHRNDTNPEVRDADHAANLSRWATLAGPMALLRRQQGPLQWNVDGLAGRVGMRFLTDDRLPLVGPLPDWTDARIPALAGPRLRDVRCAPGLLCCTALGSRGLTLAPLLGEVVASQLMGDPLPLPAALIEAIDPRRLALTGYRRTSR